MPFDGIHKSIAELLENFVKHPETLSHLLFVGPPGSGKTTTANAFVEEMYGKRKHYTGRALFLNSSDERSLESVRSKVYPFANSQIYTIFEDLGCPKKPKIIIFDEAETLTEQAQLSLRPLLNEPASNLCILFLCNSSSRLHNSLLNRFCILYFYPPPPSVYLNRVRTIMNEKSIDIAPLDSLYTRSDLRSFLFHPTRGGHVTKFIYQLLHCPLYEIRSLLEKHSKLYFIKEVLSQVIFVFTSLGLIGSQEITKVILLGNADVLRVIPEKIWFDLVAKWIQEVRQKFDCCV